MIVITLTDCPPKIRGDLSKWMFEINTGVYVGNLNVRVRDELWGRICSNLKNGRATMVYSASGEQRLDFRVHNTLWEPVDFDGIKLMRRPIPGRRPENAAETVGSGYSKAAEYNKVRRINAAKNKSNQLENYTVIDLETTGLNADSDEIMEIAALRVRNGEPKDSFSSYVKIEKQIPASITELTSITNEIVEKEGVPLETALEALERIIGNGCIMCHNAAFDYSFIRAACKKCGIEPFINTAVDTVPLAKRKLKELENYKLTTIAQYFGLDVSGAHHAMFDCNLTYSIYCKLNEI